MFNKFLRLFKFIFASQLMKLDSEVRLFYVLLEEGIAKYITLFDKIESERKKLNDEMVELLYQNKCLLIKIDFLTERIDNLTKTVLTNGCMWAQKCAERSPLNGEV